jgi:hypothetical protein
MDDPAVRKDAFRRACPDSVRWLRPESGCELRVATGGVSGDARGGTGMGSIGIALAMLAWLPQASDPASTT